MITGITSKFTLIEMLVVIAIIAILSAILMPALQAANEMAMSVLCSNNIRQSGMLNAEYADDYNGFIPLGKDGGGRDPVTNKYVNYYWFNFYKFAGLITDELDESLHCPKVKNGYYGMTLDVNKEASISYYPYGTSYSSQPYQFIGAKISKINRPSNMVFYTDAARQSYDKGSAQLELNSSSSCDLGGYIFASRYPIYNGYWQAVWLAHGNNTANSSFADGHVESCSVNRFLNVENPNSQAEDKKGISYYWCNDGIGFSFF